MAGDAPWHVLTARVWCALAAAAVLAGACGLPDTPAVAPPPADPPALPVNWHPDETGFMARGLVTRAGTTLPYRLFVPGGYRHDRRYPLVIWLHGAGGTGSDNLQQISGDQIPGTHLWLQPEHQRAHPAIVVVPQSEDMWDASEFARTLRPTSTAILELISALEAELSIDAKRIYLLGQSAGGRAVWNLLTNAPERFAASILVCPVSVDVAPLERAAKVPLWVFQGSDDGLLKETKDCVNALQRAGGHPRLTEYKGAGHDIWNQVFQEPGLAEWLFSQRR